jgi:puromycin-sensitive aminopeptidase
MKNWTEKPGYPVISFSSKNGVVELTQERFFSSGMGEKNDQKWLVPFAIKANGGKVTSTLIEKKKAQLKISGNNTWLKGNADDTSFVRVNYSAKDLEQLEIAVRANDPMLSEKGRFALVRDVFALVEAGKVSTDEALKLVDAYKKETSYIEWAEIVSHLLELNYLLNGEKVYDDFRIFARGVLKEIASHVGWDKKRGESHELTLLRSAVLYGLGALGDKITIQKAQSLFKAIMNIKIDSDLRSFVYALVAENGGKKEYEVFEKIYMTAPSEEEKDRALRAMASFKDEALLKKTLALAFSPDVRSQDAFKAVSLLSGNPYGIAIAWGYVKEEWSSIVEKFAGGHLFARFISPFSKFKTKKQADELEKFFKKNNASGIERTVAQAVEKIRANDALLRRDIKRIELFLKN